MATDLDAALDRLAAVPPREFTKARDALARELRAKGETDLAAEIQGRKRPTSGEWALAALARDDAGTIRDLLALGSRGRGADPREAGERANELVRALVGRARDLLEGAGVKATPEVLRQVEATLRAAPLAPAGERERLARGRLEGGLEPGADAAALARAPRGRGRARAKPAKKDLAAREKAKREAEAEAARAGARRERERKKALAAARREGARLEKDAARSEGVARKARAEADAAERRARDARSKAAALEVDAQAARRRADRAARDLERLERGTSEPT